MKKINFFALALALLMGISFTSCLDSDNNAGYDAAGYVRVASSMYGVQLKDLDGNRFLPTMASLAALKQQGVDLTSSEYDLVYVYLKWVEETANKTKAGEARQVELVAASPVSKGKAFRQVNGMDELVVVNEAPVVTLLPSTGAGYGNTKPWLYGSELIVVPVHWRMKNDKDMLKQHTFTLNYVEGVSTNEQLQGNKTLALYLLHDKGTDNEEKNKLVDAANNFTFDIHDYLERYKMENGAYPTKVVVKAKINPDGYTLPVASEGEDAEKVWTSFDVDMELFNQMQKK